MGGTGLAIWLRHRRSEDLDIFCPGRLDVDSVVSALSASGEFFLREASERLVRGVVDGVNVDVVGEDGAYRLAPPLEIDGLRVASLQDITAGKFRAITGRKQMRDLVDAMFIETEGGIRLEQAIMLHFRKYGIAPQHSEVDGVLRHLVDFSHLDDDPAMEESFGRDIRIRVEEYFRSRQPQVAAAFQQILAEDC